MEDLPFAIAIPDTQGGLCFLHSVEGDRYYTLDGALRYPTFKAASDDCLKAANISVKQRTYIIVNINELRRHIA